ncbi:hypothetical protein [Sinosporangium siamense]|uniref:CU044_5270 family protein n=1 Tax=Sinosporangium siamense TaxID=1367973 RepID=A0A919RQE3_9ACTN|nr:hypothetical protein [Sinosporangium siamense]GII96521.1 hypothetical protein Ssi02_67520 [Sinosporangium siamense]
MIDKFDDVRRLMRSLDPIRRDRFAGAAQSPEARETLRRIVAENAAPSRSRPPRRRIMVLGAAGLATACAVTVGLVSWTTPLQYPATPEILTYTLAGHSVSQDDTLPSARRALLALAETAAGQPARPVPPGAAYSHVSRNEWNLITSFSHGRTTSEIVPAVVEQWTPLRREGRIRRISSPGHPLATRYEGEAAAGTAVRPVLEETFPVDAGHFPPVSALPGDLHKALLDRVNLPEAGETHRLVQSVIALHLQQTVPPGDAARLWRLLAERPDLKHLGTVVDRAGRKGEAVALDEKYSLPRRWALIIAPETGELLAVEEMLTENAGKLNLDVPAVIGYKLLLNGDYAQNPGS